MNPETPAKITAIGEKLDNPPPRIGDIWPGQGGTYVGIMRGVSSRPDYHLICATKDIGDHIWSHDMVMVDRNFSTIDGASNTVQLLASGSHPATESAAKFTADGHTDFYLPSPHELELIYINAPDGFENSVYYWTSAPRSHYYAYVQNFAYGNRNWSSKDTLARVRPVRRILVLPVAAQTENTTNIKANE